MLILIVNLGGILRVFEHEDEDDDEDDSIPKEFQTGSEPELCS